MNLRPAPQLDTFADLISGFKDRTPLTPQQAAVRMGLPAHRGNAMLQRIRQRLGWQAQ